MRSQALVLVLVAVISVAVSACGGVRRSTVTSGVSPPARATAAAPAAEPPLSYQGQELVPVVSLAVGAPCRRPRVVVSATLPAFYEVQGDQLLQAILSGAQRAFGGAVAPLTPGLPHGPVGVHLQVPNRALRIGLSADHGFSSGSYGEFGFAEVPVIPSSTSRQGNVGEAIVIPFASPIQAARFENAYIRSSCAAEFIPPPVRAGLRAALRAPVVTPDNLVGLVAALPRPIFDKRDVVLEDAVIGRYIIHIQIYANFQTLTAAQHDAPFALAYALATAGITYLPCDPSGTHCARAGSNSTLLASI